MPSALTLVSDAKRHTDYPQTPNSILRAKAAQLCERADVERRCPELMFDGDRLVRRAPLSELDCLAYALDRTLDVIEDMLATVRK